MAEEHFKSSRDIKKEQRDKFLKRAQEHCRLMRGTFGNLRTKVNYIEKTGEIPELQVLRGYRKQLQLISSAIRKYRRAGIEPPISHGHINHLGARITKLLLGEVASSPSQASTPKPTSRGEQVQVLLDKVNTGTGKIHDPAVHGIIILLKDAARERLLGATATTMVKRAAELRVQQRWNIRETEDYLQERLLGPVLNAVYKGFLVELERSKKTVDKSVLAYIESCIKGPGAIKEFITILKIGGVKSG